MYCPSLVFMRFHKCVARESGAGKVSGVVHVYRCFSKILGITVFDGILKLFDTWRVPICSCRVLKHRWREHVVAAAEIGFQRLQTARVTHIRRSFDTSYRGGSHGVIQFFRLY